jgi:hypothetical protein
MWWGIRQEKKKGSFEVPVHSFGANSESIMKASFLNITEKWGVLVQKL